jgi:hypothetical protein
MPNCSADLEFIRNHPNRAVGHRSYVKQMPLAMDLPTAGGGGVYADVTGMAKFVQFFLNGGKVDGQTVLEESLITNMVTPSIRTKDYGLGVDIFPNTDAFILGHTGVGLGFESCMIWLPEYEIGGVFLFNSELSGWNIGDIFSDLINENLIQKSESFEIPSGEYQAYHPLDPNTFTPFKPAWEKYIGTYKYIMSGWKPSTSLRIALALGLTTNYTHVKVYEKDGYLYVDSAQDFDDDGGRLDEHLPGLFFTPTGKCLDLRGPKFTWQNWKIKKTDNDANRNFDINL